MCVELAPAYFCMDDEDGLASLVAVVREEGDFSWAEGFEDDRAVLLETVEECPVDIIELEG